MPNDLDARCSEACTRAGTFALLLSAVAISLLNPLVVEYVRTSLLEYINLREALKEEVNRISGDSCWQKLSGQLEGFPLDELRKYICIEESADNGNNHIQLSVHASETAPKSKTQLAWDPPDPTEPSMPLGPPQNFRIITEYPLPHLSRLINILTKLYDTDLLRAARRYSPRFNSSVSRWTTSRSRMRRGNLNRQGVLVVQGGSPTSARSADVSTEYLSDFTLADIKELANLESPDPTAFEELRLTRPTIQTPGISFQIQLEAGGILVEIAIFLTVVYFWTFHHEARVSSNFPAPGTLFAAFRRTPASRLIFHILVVVPAVCSILLAGWLSAHSRNPYMKLTFVPALLTICFTLAILKSSLPIKLDYVKDAIGRGFGRIADQVRHSHGAEP